MSFVHSLFDDGRMAEHQPFRNGKHQRPNFNDVPDAVVMKPTVLNVWSHLQTKYGIYELNELMIFSGYPEAVETYNLPIWRRA